MDQKPVINYPSQFALLLGLMGGGIILCAVLPLIGSSVMHVKVAQFQTAIEKPENANVFRIINTVGAFFVFFLPAFILVRVLSKNPFAQLGFSRGISFKQMVLVLALTLVSIFLKRRTRTIK
jgi:hypothetical protein